jgi:4-amino-4-deoxy-L-arabinose transferase-like glycosyltransferase
MKAAPGLVVSIIFVALAIALSSIRPLWIDEILQLLTTRQSSVAQLIVEVPRNPGASPLGYLIQQGSLRLTGYSVTAARLPEAVFGGAAVFMVALLAGQLGLRRGWISASLFAIFPLTLRYASESRVYAPALFFSVLATYIYVRIAQRPSAWLVAAYVLALTAAVYTQPFAASVGVAHIAWSVTEKDRKTALTGLAGLCFAMLAFLPWFLWARARWNAEIVIQEFSFAFSAKTPLMIFREILGAGYWGTGLLVILCAFCIRHCALGASQRNLIGLLIALPILGGVIVDAWFGYFIATRQFMWVLPACALIGAAALETRRKGAWITAALLALVCMQQSYKYFTSPYEDWGAAAALAEKEVGSDGCFLTFPAEHAKRYVFFAPELRVCGVPARHVVLALSPYASQRERDLAFERLKLIGYTLQRESKSGRFSMVSFVR